MKKLAALFTVLLLFCSARASEPFTVGAKGAVLIDGASGRVLFAPNADEMLPMASTTTIMTALLALENCELTESVTASKNAHGVPGTSIYLSEGETLTMEQMLYGLMLRSGNDAAVAIAEHIAGSVEDFAAMMNRRAEELGVDASYQNPHGLDAENHAASALALAQIFRQAMQLEDFRTITSTQRKIIPWVGNTYSRVLENKNRLLTTYEGATGGKTGYTSRAGRCLVFSAKREGMELIGCVLNCPTWFDTATVLLDYGFENYRMKTFLEEGQFVVDAEVRGGLDGTVAVRASQSLQAAVGLDEHFTVRYDFGEGLSAPIKAGDPVGRAILEIDGETVAQCDLLAAESVEKLTVGNALRRVLENWVALFS